MGEARISRRAVVRAGDAAMESLQQQRQMFEEQQAVMDSAMAKFGKMVKEVEALRLRVSEQNIEIEALKDSVEAARTNRVAFESRGFRDRLRWVILGH